MAGARSIRVRYRSLVAMSQDNCSNLLIAVWHGRLEKKKITIWRQLACITFTYSPG